MANTGRGWPKSVRGAAGAPSDRRGGRREGGSAAPASRRPERGASKVRASASGTERRGGGKGRGLTSSASVWVGAGRVAGGGERLEQCTEAGARRRARVAGSGGRDRSEPPSGKGRTRAAALRTRRFERKSGGESSCSARDVPRSKRESSRFPFGSHALASNVPVQNPKHRRLQRIQAVFHDIAERREESV